MKNKIHVFSWILYEKFILRENPKLLFTSTQLQPYMKKKIDFAKKFGGVELVIIGDSNAENLDYDDISKFIPITINIAKGGTKFNDWVEFFNSLPGKEIYESIKNCNHLISLGGNHAVHNAMDIFKKSMNEFFKLFPNAWYMNVPRVHSKLIESLGITKKTWQEIDEEVQYINKQLKKKTNKIIDLYSLTGSGEDTQPFYMVHEDLVHFSKDFDKKIRVPYIKMVTGF